MHEYDHLTGHEFPIPSNDITGSCIDYWFNNDEILDQTQNNQLVPEGYQAIARDPGDSLILLNISSGSIHYCDHETGKLYKLASSLSEFSATIKT